jgi:hypothetical protein
VLDLSPFDCVLTVAQKLLKVHVLEQGHLRCKKGVNY